MGQKIHPIGFRLGVIEDWQSKWYASKDYRSTFLQDLELRDLIENWDFAQNRKARRREITRGRVKPHFISKVLIERYPKSVNITLHTARPSVVIGSKGQSIEALRKAVGELVGKQANILVQEVKNPSLDAQYLAVQVAKSLERRASHKRTMKQAIDQVMAAGAEGVRIRCAGRLGGAEMGRTEWYIQGRVPLHTLRARIDFAQSTAYTTYGTTGVKVWVYKGAVDTSEALAVRQS